MIPLLASPPARFTFVVGKGGVGKSTSAAALALHWAAERPVHLLSTDPAHSLGDVFHHPLPIGEPVAVCTPTLTVEQLDAGARAVAWQERARAPLVALLGSGSYLGDEDIERLTALPLPGTGEVMAALRLAELAAAAVTVVVDTAPTGPTLALLDSHQVLASWCTMLTALAAKGDAVARALTGHVRHGPAEDFRHRLEAEAEQFRHAVLGQARFLVVTRSGELVSVETARLRAELRARKLPLLATLVLPEVGAPAAAAGAVIQLPWLEPPARGCDALRTWSARLGSPGGEQAPAGPPAGNRTGQASEWLRARSERLLLFAGKGGVGKSTCAAAAAVTLSRGRQVLLLGTDRGGSLSDLLQVTLAAEPVEVAPRLRAAQVDAAAALADWRDLAGGEFEPLLTRAGLGGDPTLDRDVLQALWNVTPPGLDELAALSQLLELADEAETVVVDASPTGHFLRLIELPELALDWTHALMRLLLEYGVTGELDALTKRVLAFARQLKSLRTRLADAGWTGTVIVTMAEPVVEAETARLATSLSRAGIPITAILTNFQAERAAAVPLAVPRLGAPALLPAPHGVDGLGRFTELWELQ